MPKMRVTGEGESWTYKPGLTSLTKRCGISLSRSSNLKSHYSLEDYARLNKRCKEDAVAELVHSYESRLGGIATAPPCGTSLISPGRGLKRKIGCIDLATQMGRRRKKIEEDYILGTPLGHGKFGSVCLCKCTTSGAEFACKRLKKGEETVHREVEIMQHLSGHPGVVNLQAVYEDTEYFHLVMELCPAGRLIDQMLSEGRYSEQRAANIFKEAMFVIKYCHDMGVVHRDIKPENILLTLSGKIKLADFGLAVRISNGQSLTSLVGSPAYVAPEVLSGKYSEEVDSWSAGVLLHALLVGTLPFQGDSLETVFEAIKSMKLDFCSGPWLPISKPARDLIGRTLTRDVSARITAEEVLRHPWILFYTDRTLKSLPFKTKAMNLVVESVHHPDITLKTKAYSEEYSNPITPSESCHSEDRDECGLVDALASAISHMRISEPKRTRLCSPASPIEQQCSSNMKANHLCKAF